MVEEYKICDRSYKIIDKEYFLGSCCNKEVGDGYVKEICDDEEINFTCDSSVDTIFELQNNLNKFYLKWVNDNLQRLDDEVKNQEDCKAINNCRNEDNEVCYSCLKYKFYDKFLYDLYPPNYTWIDCGALEWGKSLSDMDDIERKNVKYLRDRQLSMANDFIEWFNGVVESADEFQSAYPEFDFKVDELKNEFNEERLNTIISIRDYWQENFEKWEQ